MQSDKELSARLLLLENQVSEVRTEVRRKHRTGRDGVQPHAILEILFTTRRIIGCRASNIRGRVATDPLMRARRYSRTRRRNEWN